MIVAPSSWYETLGIPPPPSNAFVVVMYWTEEVELLIVVLVVLVELAVDEVIVDGAPSEIT